jgi:hypothetical protein
MLNKIIIFVTMKQFLRATKVFSLLTGVVLILLASCKKKEETYQATFNLYATKTPYSFAFVENDEDREVIVNTQHFSKTIEVKEGYLSKQMGIIKTNKTFPDSIHVQATINGKVAEASSTINCACAAMVTIQLSQAK